MAKEDIKREDKALAQYGIIYLSGDIDTASAETICKEIIEHNIKGDVSQMR